MKKLRRLIVICLSVAMIFVGTVGASAESISNATYLQNNYEATTGYTRMLETFDINGITADPSYPQEYGGAYINDQGNLVVQYVETSSDDAVVMQQGADSVSEAQAFSDTVYEVTGLQTVLIEKVNYSYNELVETNNFIGSHITKLISSENELSTLQNTTESSFKGEIVQSAIDAKNNSVVVWLDDISQECIEDFRENICDEPYLTFKLAIGRPILESNYESGEGWVNGIGSIGFPANYGSYSGFVTAWHCSEAGTNYINDQAYGTRLNGSSEYDYAFIRQTNYTDSITRGLYDSTKTLNAGTYAYLAQGSQVGRTGYKTGYSTGTVTYTGVNNELGNDLMETNCGSEPGDSGGPYFGSPSSSTPYVAGIHIGASTQVEETTFFRGISYLLSAGYSIIW